jgi:hypothetical protein
MLSRRSRREDMSWVKDLKNLYNTLSDLLNREKIRDEMTDVYFNDDSRFKYICVKLSIKYSLLVGTADKKVEQGVEKDMYDSHADVGQAYESILESRSTNLSYGQVDPSFLQEDSGDSNLVIMIQKFQNGSTKIRLCNGDWGLQKFTPIYDERFHLTESNYAKYDDKMAGSRDYIRTGYKVLNQIIDNLLSFMSSRYTDNEFCKDLMTMDSKEMHKTFDISSKDKMAKNLGNLDKANDMSKWQMFAVMSKKMSELQAKCEQLEHKLEQKTEQRGMQTQQIYNEPQRGGYREDEYYEDDFDYT